MYNFPSKQYLTPYGYFPKFTIFQDIFPKDFTKHFRTIFCLKTSSNPEIHQYSIIPDQKLCLLVYYVRSLLYPRSSFSFIISLYLYLQITQQTDITIDVLHFRYCIRLLAVAPVFVFFWSTLVGTFISHSSIQRYHRT